MEKLVYGKNEQEPKIQTKIMTDSLPTLETIASSTQCEKKMMRPVIGKLKEALKMKEVMSYSWLKTTEMVADILTKEVKTSEMVTKLMEKGPLPITRNRDYEVTYENKQFKISNRKNKNSPSVRFEEGNLTL